MHINTDDQGTFWLVFAFYFSSCYNSRIYCRSGVRRKFSWGVHSVAHGGHLIWSALCVTSQFDVIFMFPNQRFDEVC